jgi:Ser/Thr protein kinase RdoA (MazF antagonist)
VKDGLAPGRDVSVESEERHLRAWVEHCLGARVEDMERRALPADSGSSGGELLTVATGARTVELLLKDHGRRRLPGDDGERAAREIEVYRRILDPELLGTPRHLGWRLEAQDGRSWLLLEHVRGTLLRDLSFEHWRAAAAWLGRLQGHAAARGLALDPPAFLLRHDLAHLSSTAEEAFRAVASIDVGLEQDLRDAIEGYQEGFRRLDAQPRTLVQGSFRPENVLLDPAAPPRVIPLDWEHAALGCALHDVAALVNGLDRERRMQLLEVHRAAALELGLPLPEDPEARELLAILRQYDLLRALGRSVRCSAPRRTIEQQIALASGTRLDLRSFRHKRNRVSSGPNGRLEPLQTEPVLRAWQSLGREERVTGVELICGSPAGSKRRSVYRLRTDGRFASVVAKHSWRPALATERFVYSELLPRLPLPTPGYVGWAEDSEARWLFIEDVGSMRASREDQTHRTCGTAWLGALHAAGTRLDRDERVPERGPRWFLESLRNSRQTILSSLGNPVFSAGDRRSMRAVAERCERIESRWERIGAACAEQPLTLVHADFQPKNLYLRPGAEGLTLFPIDWEYASWSVPGLDLGTILRKGYTAVELEAYERTSGWEAARLPRWISLGCALRAVLAIRWASVDLPLRFPEVGLRSLPEYARDLERAFEELGA